MVSEQHLLQRARRLEQDALVEVYDAYSEALYRYALRQLGDQDLAQDCVGETFCRLLRALHERRGPRRYLRAYLYRVAHNWISDAYRRRPVEPLPEADCLSDGDGVDPPAAVVERTEQERVRAALARLTPDQRQVIALKYWEGWDNREVARALRKPVGAVKSLQHRALAALRRLLLDGNGTP